MKGRVTGSVCFVCALLWTILAVFAGIEIGKRSRGDFDDYRYPIRQDGADMPDFQWYDRREGMTTR